MFDSLGSQIPLSKKIELEIEKAIRGGQLSAGMKLPTEKELCEQFAVSRTAVREAISMLSARGLVSVRKGSGTYVNEISFERARRSLNLFFELSTAPDLALDTISARQIIEPEIAAYAATVRSEEQITKLAANMERMRACPIGDVEQEAALDNEFHSEIIKSTNNEVIELLMRPIYSLIPKFRKQIFVKTDATSIEKEKELLIKYHNDIFLAIKNQDAVKARNSMVEHLDQSKYNYLKKNVKDQIHPIT